MQEFESHRLPNLSTGFNLDNNRASSKMSLIISVIKIWGPGQTEMNKI